MRKYTEFRGVRYATYRHKKRQHADSVITLDTESTSYFFVNGEWVTDDGKRRAPRGACELKWRIAGVFADVIGSRPSRGV